MMSRLHQNEKAPDVISAPNFSATITQEEKNKITVSSQGEFDAGYAAWEYSHNNETENYYVRKQVMFPAGVKLSVVHPQIPEKLVELYPRLGEEFTYNSVYLWENEDLNAFDYILQDIFTYTFADKQFFRYKGVTIYPESDEGSRILRGNSVDELKSRAEEVENLMRGIFK